MASELLVAQAVSAVCSANAPRCFRYRQTLRPDAWGATVNRGDCFSLRHRQGCGRVRTILVSPSGAGEGGEWGPTPLQAMINACCSDVS